MRKILAAAAIAAIAAGSAAAEPRTLQDPRAGLKIGVTALKEERLDDRQAVFAKTIPLRLRAELLALLSRKLDPEEMDAYRENARMTALFASGQALDGENDVRDKALFTESTERKMRADIKTAEEKIEARMKAIKADEALGLLFIDVKPEKKVELAQKATEPLFDAASRFPEAASAVNDVDILVSGSLTGLEDYMVLEVWAYHRFLKREIFAWKTAIAIDDTEDVVGDIAKSLVLTMSGESSARLAVRAEPDSADIFVDGVYRGRGSVVLERIAPGTHTLRAEARGYSTMESSVSLAEGASEERSFALAENGLPPIHIATVPEGAAVYLGAERIGASPASIPAGEGRISGRARMDGMEDALFASPGIQSESIEIRLEEKPADGVSPLEKAREKFYKSNGYFLLTLPLTVLSVGAFIAAMTTWNDAVTGYEEGRFSAAAYENAKTAMLGVVIVTGPVAAASVSLTGWFLGQSIFRLGRYLEAARK